MTNIYDHKFVIDLVLKSCEPRPEILENDLKQLAAYLVKIGTNVDLLRPSQKQSRFSRYPQLDVASLKRIADKYKLTWSPQCQFKDFDAIRNRSLHHIGHTNFELFLQVAATMSPGGYEERRFWWCANNYRFFLRNTERLANSRENEASRPALSSLSAAHRQSAGPNIGCEKTYFAYSPSRLLSDVLCQVLTLDEPKLIAISALHLSVKHSDSQVFLVHYERNYNWMLDQIKADKFGFKNGKSKDIWRQYFRIQETEKELDTVHVDFFIEWWNLTGLRRPAKQRFRAARD